MIIYEMTATACGCARPTDEHADCTAPGRPLVIAKVFNSVPDYRHISGARFPPLKQMARQGGTGRDCWH